MSLNRENDLRKIMYISSKARLVRNTATAIVNGAITLILLLIAPLGLAAVITNTFLVTLSTFFVCTFADQVVIWLLPSSARREPIEQGDRPWQPEKSLKNQQMSRGELEGDQE